jgi:hypothetical protein
MNTRPRLSRLLLLACIAAMLVTAYGGAPAMASTCRGAPCSNRDAATAGCTADAGTLASADSVIAGDNGGHSIHTGDYVLLRFSYACNSYWAQASQQYPNELWTISVDRKPNVSNPPVASLSKSSTGPGTFRTRMWGREAGYSYRVCISSEGGIGCTAWRS